jgi:DNA adenine methylase
LPTDYFRRFPSPLRYPGGKGKLANFMKLVFLENNLVGSDYVELYAGGASVALDLLYEEFAAHIHINDLSRSVHTFWKVVLERPNDLCDRIIHCPVTVKEWDRQRKIQSRPKPNDLDLAFSTFFLNRTCRSGIIGGGIVGGRNQNGTWKIGARYNKDDLVKRIRRVSRFSSRITLTRIDAGQYIKSRLPTISNAFVYLDPPYFVKGRGLYEDFYQLEDHVKISEVVKDMVQCRWIVSYDSVRPIRQLYAAFPRRSYALSYSAADRYQGAEIMFFHPGLKIPRVKSPACISTNFVDKKRLMGRR